MEINLLPWRKEILSHNRNQFYVLLCVTLLLSAGFLWLVYSEFFSQVIYKKQYIHALQNATTQLKNKTVASEKERKNFELAYTKVRTLENLEYSRFTTIKFFNEITAMVPQGVYFKTLSRTGPIIEITGIANSNFLIAQFIKSINASPNLVVLSLKKVEHTEQNFKSVTEFDLQLAIRFEIFYADEAEKKTDFKIGSSSTQARNIFDEKREDVRKIFLKKSLEK